MCVDTAMLLIAALYPSLVRSRYGRVRSFGTQQETTHALARSNRWNCVSTWYRELRLVCPCTSWCISISTLTSYVVLRNRLNIRRKLTNQQTKMYPNLESQSTFWDSLFSILCVITETELIANNEYGNQIVLYDYLRLHVIPWLHDTQSRVLWSPGNLTFSFSLN